MTRRALILLAVGVLSLALSVALRSADSQDAWAPLLAFTFGMLGAVSLLVGFYSAAFLAGGQKVAWPMAIYVVTIVGGTAAFLVWVNLKAPQLRGGPTWPARPTAQAPSPLP